MNLSLNNMPVIGKYLFNSSSYSLFKNLRVVAKSPHAFSYSQDVPTLPPKPKSDPINLALRSVRSTSDVLNIVKIHAPHMTPEQVALSMRTINNFLKSKSGNDKEIDILNSEEFLQLCRRLKKLVPVLEVSEVMDALKTMTFLKVPHNSVITMKLLHMIKRDVNLLNITQLMFLAFLLRHYPKNPIVDALKIAIPVVFETQLKTKLDRKNLPMLVESLIFISKNPVNRECADYVVEALCELDHLDWVTMDPRRARSIALALADLAIVGPAYETAYRDATDLLTKNLSNITFSEIDALLGIILKTSRRCSYLLHIPLFEAAAVNAVENNWNSLECSILLRKLNNVGVVSIKLLDCIADKIMEDPESFRGATFGIVKTFVNGLSVANYKTDHWPLFRDLLPASNCFKNIQPKEPWIPLCLELASLDVFDDKLLVQVFSPWFLESYLSREYNKLDLLQLLRLQLVVTALHPSYSGPAPSNDHIEEAIALNSSHVAEAQSPLEGALQMSLGRQAVLTKCKTKHGHFIDHVVVLQSGGEAVTFPEEVTSQEIINIDDLSISSDYQKVAICLLPRSSYNSLKQLRGISILITRVLEAQGFVVVNISSDNWHHMPDWEKTPYLMQQIRLKCSHIYEKEQSLVE